jgi:hypothetical protein
MMIRDQGKPLWGATDGKEMPILRALRHPSPGVHTALYSRRIAIPARRHILPSCW